MSLKEEDRRIIVEMELEKAERTFAEQKVLRDGALWSTLANRLYYALLLQLFLQHRRNRHSLQDCTCLVIHRKSKALHC